MADRRAARHSRAPFFRGGGPEKGLCPLRLSRRWGTMGKNVRCGGARRYPMDSSPLFQLPYWDALTEPQRKLAVARRNDGALVAIGV